MSYPEYWPTDAHLWTSGTAKGRFRPPPAEPKGARPDVRSSPEKQKHMLAVAGSDEIELVEMESEPERVEKVPSISKGNLRDFEFYKLPLDDPWFRAIARYVNGDVTSHPVTMDRLHEENLKSLLVSRAGGHKIGLLDAAKVLAFGGYTVNNCTIHKIKILRNATLWKQYEDCRALFQGYYARFPSAKPQEHWSPRVYNVEGTTYHFPVIDEGIGEYWLFAGSGAAGTRGIVNTGFDPSFCGWSTTTGFGKLGYGCNFTDQFAKAVTYAPCFQCNSVKPCRCVTKSGNPYYRVLFCSRVLLGTSYKALDDELRFSTNQPLTFLDPRKPLTAKQARAKESDEMTDKSGRAERLLASRPRSLATPEKSSFSLSSSRSSSAPEAIEMQESRPKPTSVLGLKALKGADGNTFDSTTFVVADGYQTYPEFLIFFTLPGQPAKKVSMFNVKVDVDKTIGNTPVFQSIRNDDL
jgi:hypothetical protein